MNFFGGTAKRAIFTIRGEVRQAGQVYLSETPSWLPELGPIFFRSRAADMKTRSTPCTMRAAAVKMETFGMGLDEGNRRGHPLH
jgi:hypothetical protein